MTHQQLSRMLSYTLNQGINKPSKLPKRFSLWWSKWAAQVKDLRAVQFRTSYFPGLGWMLRRQLWLELGPKFPLQAWDHWMRLDSTSKGNLNIDQPAQPPPALGAFIPVLTMPLPSLPSPSLPSA